MKRVISLVAGLGMLVIVATPAFAQQDRKAAITVTSPGTIGVLLPVNETVSIRPEFSFGKTSHDITTGSTTTTKFDSWELSAGVSALFYNGKPDAFRTYWSPRFMVSHADLNSTGSSAYNAAGSFGAEYNAGSRFKVFGELGLSYGWQSTDSTSTTGVSVSTSKIHEFGTRAAVGIAFRF